MQVLGTIMTWAWDARVLKTSLCYVVVHQRDVRENTKTIC